MNLPRKENSYGDTMFLRPRNPDDHRQFEVLLPQCVPLFVYADDDGRDWVRWSLPLDVARSMGWNEIKCACCGDTKLKGTEHAVEIDTAWDEVDWWLERDVDGQL